MVPFLSDGKRFDPARVDLTRRIHQVVSRTRGGTMILESTLAWRDVVNIAAFESVVFRVVQSQLGMRMYHCHILEHESQGMMGVLDVVG